MTVGSDARISAALSYTPVREGSRPVSSEARDGAHSGEAQYAASNGHAVARERGQVRRLDDVVAVGRQPRGRELVDHDQQDAGRPRAHRRGATRAPSGAPPSRAARERRRDAPLQLGLGLRARVRRVRRDDEVRRLRRRVPPRVGGSTSRTSSAAPPSRPSRSAASSAPVSHSAARAVLTSSAPRGIGAISRGAEQPARRGRAAARGARRRRHAASSSSSAAGRTPAAAIDVVRDARVARPDLEAERQRPRRDRRADPPEADDAEAGCRGSAAAGPRRSASQWPARTRRSSSTTPRISASASASARVGHLLDAVVRHVADPHAAVAAGGVEVDVVEADARRQRRRAGRAARRARPPPPGAPTTTTPTTSSPASPPSSGATVTPVRAERGAERREVDRRRRRGPVARDARPGQEAGAVTLPRATSMLGVLASSLRV